jgi:hypothetical protein
MAAADPGSPRRLNEARHMGFGKVEIDEIKQFRRERAAGNDETTFRKYFRHDLRDGLLQPAQGSAYSPSAPALCRWEKTQANGGLAALKHPHQYP